MDEQNQAEPPQRYIWPRFVLAGGGLGIVLAIVWMAVLVRRVREQRDSMSWPTNSSPVQQTNAIPSTNSMVPQASVDPSKATRMEEFKDTLAGGNAEAGRKVFFESPAA